MRRLIKAAMGEIECDTVLKNCKVADVFGKTIINGNIGILDGKIVGIGDYKGKNEVDMHGSYAMPGFIDSHVHIESSMVSPSEYALSVMPWGITSVIADPHEIANVCGTDGLSFMKQSAESVPLDVFYMLPSCVPATNFEDAGAVINSTAVNKLITEFLGLGEMMNYVGVINSDEEVLSKLTADHIDGHAPSLSRNPLNAYICAGINTDHECTSVEEMLEKLSKGMYIQIREGTLSKDLDTLISGVNSGNSRRCLFCTDDRYIGEIKQSGTINDSIVRARESGIDIFDALCMASLNTAECYGLKGFGAIAPGYFADIVIADDIVPRNITKVYKKGVLCADNGVPVFTSDASVDFSKVTNTVHIPHIKPDFFKHTPKSGSQPVIQLNKDTIITTKIITESVEGMNKVCVIERHHNTGHKAIGYVANMNIKGGAVSSTIGHDSHNIIVVGDNDSDMALAVNTLGAEGGICVSSNGKVLAYLPLPIAGLMSDLTADEVIKCHEELEKGIAVLGANKDFNPFLALAFLPLPVIPEIRITDRGLFDVVKFEFIK